MKKKLRKLSILTLVLILAMQLAVPALAFEDFLAPPSLDRATLFADGGELEILPISEAADMYTSSGIMASIQYAMMKDGELVHDGVSGVYSKYSDTKTLDSGTIFGIGSVSKTYTAVLVMKLVDEGKIALDSPVTNYIPEFEMADPRYKDITVRMLLNHSSGLMGSTYNNGLLWDDNSTEAHDTLLEDLKGQRLKADPGAFSVYCNDGFSLAEILVERVSGKSYTELMDEYICAPLGISRTFTPLSDFDRSDMARTYSSNNPALEQPNETANIIGTGGILSTAGDLCRFGRIITGEAEVLSRGSLEAMENKEYLRGQWLPDDPDNSLAYGLGWDSVDLYPFSQLGIKALVKGGDTVNYHASLVVLPEYNMSAAVTSSGGASLYCQMLAAEMLLSQLLEDGVITERPLIEIEAKDSKPLDAGLKKYEGIYAVLTQIIDIRLSDDGTMTISYPNFPGMGEKAHYIGDGLFQAADGVVQMRFIEQNGNTYLVEKDIISLAGTGQAVLQIYSGQQLPENVLSDQVFEAWNARSAAPFFHANLKYNSLHYSSGIPTLSAVVTDKSIGYLGSARIVDENSALSIQQIPVSYGRDLSDYSFYTGSYVLSEADFAAYSDYELVSRDSIKPIFGGNRSVCTILDDGYTRWYTVGEGLDGKTMRVECPPDSGFVVYDALGILINQSGMSGDNSALLYEGGYIAFAGEPGTKFAITIE